MSTINKLLAGYSNVVVCIPSIIFLLSIVPISIACLTPEQSSAIANITSHLNMSNSTLLSIFEMLCWNISSTINNSALIISNLSNFYNSSQTDVKIQNINTLLYSNVTSIYSNLSSLYNNVSSISENISSVSLNISNSASAAANSSALSALKGYDSQIDDRFSAIKKNYLSKNEFNNTYNNLTSYIDSKMNIINNYVTERTSSTKQVWMWLFFAGVGSMFGLAWLVKYHPERISFITGFKSTRRSVFEITEPGDLKTKIDRVRELSLKAVETKLSKEEKQLLLNKIRDETIIDEKSLDEEIAILERLNKKAIRSNGMKKAKKE